MIDESDWSRRDLGVDTTSGTKLHQTLPWGRGWLARLYCPLVRGLHFWDL